MQNTIPKPIWWTGTIIKGLLCLFMAFDALMKIIKNPSAVESSVQMGLPYVFPIVVAVFIVIGEFLRNGKIRTMVPFAK